MHRLNTSPNTQRLERAGLLVENYYSDCESPVSVTQVAKNVLAALGWIHGVCHVTFANLNF